MYRYALSMALLGGFALPAQALVTVESMTITGGTLEVTAPDGVSMFGILNLIPGSAATVDDGLLNGVIDADGHHGSPSNPVVTTTLLDIPVLGYFAHSAVTCNAGCSEMITIHDPDPNAITMTGPWAPEISADFSGFFVDFNGNQFLQGGTATGTANWIAYPTAEGHGGIFDFTLSWSAYNAQGPFEGLTGHWTLTGTAVMAVPEAESWALMLAGLGLVGAVTRRRHRNPDCSQTSAGQAFTREHSNQCKLAL